MMNIRANISVWILCILTNIFICSCSSGSLRPTLVFHCKIDDLRKSPSFETEVIACLKNDDGSEKTLGTGNKAITLSFYEKGTDAKVTDGDSDYKMFAVVYDGKPHNIYLKNSKGERVTYEITNFWLVSGVPDSYDVTLTLHNK